MDTRHALLLFLILTPVLGIRRKRKPCKEAKPVDVRGGCGVSCNGRTGKWIESSDCSSAAFDDPPIPSIDVQICDIKYSYTQRIEYSEDTEDTGCYIYEGEPKWCQYYEEWYECEEECEGDPCEYTCDNTTDASLCQVRHEETGHIGTCFLTPDGIECSNTPDGCQQCDIGNSGLHAVTCWRWDQHSPCPTHSVDEAVTEIATKEDRRKRRRKGACLGPRPTGGCSLTCNRVTGEWVQRNCGQFQF